MERLHQVIPRKSQEQKPPREKHKMQNVHTTIREGGERREREKEREEKEGRGQKRKEWFIFPPRTESPTSVIHPATCLAQFAEHSF